MQTDHVVKVEEFNWSLCWAVASGGQQEEVDAEGGRTVLCLLVSTENHDSLLCTSQAESLFWPAVYMEGAHERQF